jgi:hypothetical protein
MTSFEHAQMPSLEGATAWLNSKPLGPAALKGHVPGSLDHRLAELDVRAHENVLGRDPGCRDVGGVLDGLERGGRGNARRLLPAWPTGGLNLMLLIADDPDVPPVRHDFTMYERTL